MTSQTRHTVCIVTNIPRPYRQALFRVLRAQLAEEGLELKVIYSSDPTKHSRRGGKRQEIEGHWQQYAPAFSLRIGYERVVSFPRGLCSLLRQAEPVCVIAGGFSLDSLLAALYCRRRHVPYLLWSGAWPGREGRLGPISTLFRKFLVHQAGACIVYGSAAADYLVSLGAKLDHVFYAWNTVDLESFAAAALAASARRQELTARFGLAKRNLLYVGSLVASKGVVELVHAALTVDGPEPDWALHLVGDGPQRPYLEDVIRASGKQDRFRFHGLRPQEEVAQLLGLADALFLPTKREAWGLVINEAMACGVPVVVSPQAGATRDLVKDGVTGYVIEPQDLSALAAVMSRIIGGDPACREVGKAGAVAVREKASLEQSAAGFLSAIRYVLQAQCGGKSS